MSQENPAATMARIRSEIQTQMMQDLMSKITENCFKVCTGKRGEHLDSSEKNCLHNCMDRYMDTMGVVNQSLVSRQHS